MRTIRALSAVLVLASPAVSCTDPTDPGERAVEQQLLFLSNRLDDSLYYGRPVADIYAVNVDGAGVRRVTENPGLNWQLDVSADGRRIVYAGPEASLWTMNADGTARTRLTDWATDRSNMDAHWSPGAARIAFLSNREQRRYGSTVGVYDVYVMNADGSDPRNVSRPLGDALGFDPHVMGWTPDGRLAFEAAGTGDGVTWSQLYVVNADGSGLQPFLQPNDADALWSPDGSRVVFNRADGSWPGYGRAYIADADGSFARPLTSEGDFFIPKLPGAGGPRKAWSPDGKRVIVSRIREPGPGIYVINADGTGLRRIADGYGAEFTGWSLDGTRIAFHQNGEVFVVGADGKGMTNVSNSSSEDFEAVWVRR